MKDNNLLIKERHSRRAIYSRRILFLFAVATLIVMSFSFRSYRALAQGSSSGLGVGRGDGLEVGINLTAFNQLKADVAAGLYDRPCTAAEHDPTKWHTLVNVQAKCHYDHMHGDDPNYVNDIFGEPGAWFGNPGQSISYPWQTFKAQTALEPNTQYVANGQMENDMKHEGYLWVVRRDQQCPSGACITDFRLETHAIFGAVGMPTRYHSFSLEARLCNNGNDPSSCGIVRYGGWVDTGRLFTTAPNELRCDHGVNEIYIPLSADTLYFPIDRPDSRDEVRCHPNIVNLPTYPSSRPLAEWWAHGGGETRFQLRVYDPISNLDPSDPSHWQFFCSPTDMNCHYDASIISAFIGYTLHIHEFVGNGVRVDSNGDGRTDYRGYFNRWGGPASGCTSSSLDCIPYQYDNVPLNFSNNKEARYAQTVCENCARVDYDISPPGQRWITWFYRYADVMPTPMPPTDVPPTLEPTLEPTLPPATDVPTSTPTTIPDPTTPTLRVDLSTTSANVGERVEVSLNLFNVSNLYGLQVQCTTNPNVLVGADRMDGDGFSSATSFFVDNGFQVDTGSWMVAASRLQPSEPISGNVTAFKLGYMVQSADVSGVDCTVLAVNSNGQQLPLDVMNAAFDGSPSEPTAVESPPVESTNTPTPPTETPIPPTETPIPPTETPIPTATMATPEVTAEGIESGVISGTVQYQNHPTQAGITVQLLSDSMTPVSLVTNDNGLFSFTDVPLGVYMLEASAPGHLTVNIVVSVDGGGQTVDVGVITLPAGDTDNSGMIDISDAGLIGANFGVSAPPAPAEADLNMDATVDVRDLVLVGGNFGKIGPVTMP